MSDATDVREDNLIVRDGQESHEASDDDVTLTTTDGGKDTSVTDAKDTKPEEDADKEREILYLRGLARDQRRQLDDLSHKTASIEDKLRKSNIITEEDEQEQARQQLAYNQRVQQLEDILAVMEVNPKFEDVHTVVSSENFDDMVAIMAKSVASKGETTEVDAARQLRAEIWALPNPYKYMYEMIKQYHPKYASKDAGVTAKEGALSAAEGGLKGGRKPSATTSPTSVVDIPGGVSSTNTGWTAAAIDALPYEKLGSVPADVYELYMQNKLP